MKEFDGDGAGESLTGFHLFFDFYSFLGLQPFASHVFERLLMLFEVDLGILSGLYQMAHRLFLFPLSQVIPLVPVLILAQLNRLL